jgi:beta-lactamase superfamily II metal-dependent hydrolase
VSLGVAFLVSNPDIDHIGSFVDVFDAFEVGVVYVSGDPKGTLTYNTFLRGAHYEGAALERYAPDAGWIGAGCKPMRVFQNTQSLELRFRALLDEGASEVQLVLS